MSIQVSDTLRVIEGGFAHYCPGCHTMHGIATREPYPFERRWRFNGNLHAPTFAPAVTMIDTSSVCTYLLEHGTLYFGERCSHELAGKAVPLPPLPAKMRDH